MLVDCVYGTNQFFAKLHYNIDFIYNIVEVEYFDDYLVMQTKVLV